MSRVRVPSPALFYKDLQVISKSHYWACVPFVYPEAFSVFSKISEKYPNTPIYSIREIEALEGLETAEGGRKPIEEKKYAYVCGAGDGTRTRDIQLGKLTLYQLSYSRLTLRPMFFKNPSSAYSD